MKEKCVVYNSLSYPFKSDDTVNLVAIPEPNKYHLAFGAVFALISAPRGVASMRVNTLLCGPGCICLAPVLLLVL